MQQTVVPDVGMWSVWQPERDLYCNSFFVAAPDANLVVDPLPLSETDAREITARGGVAWIALTHRGREDAARSLARRFGARIAASALDARLLEGPVDRLLRRGDALCGATVVALEGLATPGEFALHLPERAAVVIGGALRGVPAGALRLMPDDELEDPALAVLSLRKIAALRPDHLLLGDGVPLFGNALPALWAVLEARPEIYVNRFNVADAEYVGSRRSQRPDEYAAQSFEIDAYVGAEKLGYQLGRLPPGASFCPEHWHSAEEELFYIIEGTPTLLGPRGAWELRPGDLVAFPTRPSGSHKLTNRSAAPCVMLAVAKRDERDVCFYPNSGKLLVEKTDHLVRTSPLLDYYEGE